MTAKMPYTGFIIMFFQIRALTVGMMKNGEISSTRTMPRPKKGLFTSSARAMPRVTVMIRTEPTNNRVFCSAGMKASSVTKNS